MVTGDFAKGLAKSLNSGEIEIAISSENDALAYTLVLSKAHTIGDVN
jgi:hypothetical protein